MFSVVTVIEYSRKNTVLNIYIYIYIYDNQVKGMHLVYFSYLRS